VAWHSSCQNIVIGSVQMLGGGQQGGAHRASAPTAASTSSSETHMCVLGSITVHIPQLSLHLALM
jgi:hypothetical protein